MKLAAQTKAQVEDMVKKVQVIGMQGGIMANIPGAPYSAEQVTENTQTLGDGTRIHSENAVKIYRDSHGRVRRETPEMISIMDPVAGEGFTLYPKSMTYTTMKMSVSTNHGPGSFSYSATASSPKLSQTFVQTQAWAEEKGAHAEGSSISSTAKGGVGYAYSTSDGPITVLPSFNFDFAPENGKAAPQIKAESLGPQSMQSVNVQGERRTRTIEAGAIGNDRQIKIVDEHWYSSELQLDLVSRHNDPRTGEQLVTLVNLSRSEPDPSLFTVPAGYQQTEWQRKMIHQ
jgi:hypothetical protein